MERFFQDSFFSLLLAVILIVGVVCIPVASFLLGHVFGSRVKKEIDQRIDRITPDTPTTKPSALVSPPLDSQKVFDQGRENGAYAVAQGIAYARANDANFDAAFNDISPEVKKAMTITDPDIKAVVDGANKYAFREANNRPVFAAADAKTS